MRGVQGIAPGARKTAQPHASLLSSLSVRAQRRTPSRRPRGRQLSRMPGNSSTFLTLARSDHDLRKRWRPTKADRTGACFPRAQRGRPSAPVRACAKRESPTARRRRRASTSPRYQFCTCQPRARAALSNLRSGLTATGTSTFASNGRSVMLSLKKVTLSKPMPYFSSST